MTTKQLIDSAVEHLRTSASVKTVYGEPVVIDGKTIIPVARVTYGFGGGTGTKQAPAAAEAGEGAGGGVSAKPVGVVEITGQETKFVSFGQSKKVAMAAVIGSGLGLVLGLVLGSRSKN
jgi:uncharacterized spore protein YtfJ